MTVQERLARHLGCTPEIAAALWVAANATVVGDVVLGPRSSVFYGAVLRGDIARIRVGEGTNLQDNVIVHLADDRDALIGAWCTVGHGAIVHACTIEDECLIGMGATVLDGARIGARCIVGAGAVVTPRTVIPPGSMALGAPAKVARALSAEEQAGLRGWAEKIPRGGRRARGARAACRRRGLNRRRLRSKRCGECGGPPRRKARHRRAGTGDGTACPMGHALGRCTELSRGRGSADLSRIGARGGLPPPFPSPRSVSALPLRATSCSGLAGHTQRTLSTLRRYAPALAVSLQFPPLFRWAGALLAFACTMPLPAAPEIDLSRTTPVPSDEPIPLVDFFRPALLRSPALNPAGTHVAAIVTGNKDAELLFVYDVATKKEDYLSGMASREIYAFNWLNDRRLVFSLSQDKLYGIGLAAADVGELGDAYPILQLCGVSMIRVPRQDPLRPLLWMRYEVEDGKAAGVVRVNTNLRKGGFLNPNAVTSWSDIVNVRESNNAHILKRYPQLPGMAVYYSANSGDELEFGVTVSDGIPTLHQLTDNKWKKSPADIEEIELLGTGERPGELIVRGPRREGKPRQLQFMDAATGALGEVLLEDATHDFEGYLYRDSVSGVYVGGVFHRSGPQVVWFNEVYRALQKLLDGYFPGMVVRIVSTNDDLTRCMVATWSDRQPAIYQWVDFTARKMERFKSSRPWIDPARMRPMSIFKFKTRDGYQLEGYVTLPEGASKEKPVPLVVMPHGGPHARDTWGFNEEVQALASRGYAVLQPNYRGSDGYNWIYPEADKWAFRKMHDDVTDALRTVLRTGLIDRDRIAIMGASFGGYLSVCGVAYEPELYRCAVTIAGVFDGAAMMRDAKFDRFDSADYGVLRRKLGDPKQEKEKFDAISPINAVSAIKVPVFVAHGKEDHVVDVGESKRLVAALKRHGVPHEVMLKGGEGHGMAHVKNQVELYSRIEAFLAQHLAPRK